MTYGMDSDKFNGFLVKIFFFFFDCCCFQYWLLKTFVSLKINKFIPFFFVGIFRWLILIRWKFLWWIFNLSTLKLKTKIEIRNNVSRSDGKILVSLLLLLFRLITVSKALQIQILIIKNKLVEIKSNEIIVETKNTTCLSFYLRCQSLGKINTHEEYEIM